MGVQIATVESKALSLEHRLGSQRAAGLRAALADQPFRRLGNAPQGTIDKSRLCQMVHVDPDLSAPRRVLGTEELSYRIHDLSSGLKAVEALAASGLERIYLQTVPSQPRPVTATLEVMLNAIQVVQNNFGSAVKLIVDPQALCMRQDLRWGLTADDGSVDAEQTLILLGSAVEEFARLGVFGVMTIGRINGEVEVARAALNLVDGGTRLYSFSTNSETPTAYFERTGGDPRRAVTGQKILVGNAIDMVLRTLGDLDDGIDGMLQKPIENIYVLGVLADLVQGRTTITNYLSSPPVRQYLDKNPTILQYNSNLSVKNLSTLPVMNLSLGAYEVSGTFSARSLLVEHYGESIAWAVAEETYLTALAAANGQLEMIIGRGMDWFVATGSRLGYM